MLRATISRVRVLSPLQTSGKHVSAMVVAGGRVRSYAQQMPPRPKINEEEIEEKWLKGSGPGGQKINKTSSAVQIKHIPTGLVVKSQATRSRSQNREIARRLLAEKLEVMDKGEESRMAMKTAVKVKKKASADKKKRRKYRKLEEEKGNAMQEAADGDASEVSKQEEG